MSSDSTAYDPYRTPSLPQGQAAESGFSGRPGWLTVLCVLCIVIGVLGLMNGIVGVGATIFGEQFQTMFTPAGGQPGMPPEMQQVQEKFQAESLAVQNKFYVSILIACVLRIAVAGALLVGGIRCLALAESGRQMLLLACGAAILFELGAAVLQAFISMEMMTAMNGLMEGMLQTMPQRGGPSPELFMTIMKGMMIGGLVMQYVMVFLKIAFYVWCVLFLQRQAIKALFGPAGPAGAPALS